MRVRVLASPKPGYNMPLDEALVLTGQEANICYMKADIETILSEPVVNSLKRARGTIGNGHHSVADHVHYNLAFEGIPKILAMLLNNEKDYDTSEKSARYTEMQAAPEEEEVYKKWIEILKGLILETYPRMDEGVAQKRAQENARYMLSVFTPATSMGHTLSLRRINYTIGYCDDLIAMETTNSFLVAMKPWLVQLRDALEPFNVPGLRDNKAHIYSALFGSTDGVLGEGKGYGFSMLARRERTENIGESFCINSEGTFAMLAQLQRHRFMMHDEILLPDLENFRFFTPPIIRSAALQREWAKDMLSCKERFPQGMMLDICSIGFVDSFVRLAQERLCGAAQYEICIWANKTLSRLISGCIEQGCVPAAKELLELERKGTKCKFGNYVCQRACPLGPNEAFTRLI